MKKKKRIKGSKELKNFFWKLILIVWLIFEKKRWFWGGLQEKFMKRSTIFSTKGLRRMRAEMKWKKEFFITKLFERFLCKGRRIS